MAEARRTYLITGASAGIGLAYARAYARRGNDVILTARRAERLAATADELTAAHGIAAHVFADDLADPAAPKRLLDAVAAKGIAIDGLVNNAGYGLPGAYAATSWEDQAAFLQVMVTAPCELAHRLLPGMLERRFGRITNIASLAGLVPGAAGHTLYGAVKATLIKFSESLAAETYGTGVNVCAVCPGFTYSEFHDVNGTRGQVSQMPSWMWKTADEVVDIGLRAVEAGDPVCVTGGANKAIAGLVRLLPDPLAYAMVRGQSKRFRRTDV
jgi:uncharacterized protein